MGFVKSFCTILLSEDLTPDPERRAIHIQTIVGALCNLTNRIGRNRDYLVRSMHPASVIHALLRHAKYFSVADTMVFFHLLTCTFNAGDDFNPNTKSTRTHLEIKTLETDTYLRLARFPPFLRRLSAFLALPVPCEALPLPAAVSLGSGLNVLCSTILECWESKDEALMAQVIPKFFHQCGPDLLRLSNSLPNLQLQLQAKIQMVITLWESMNLVHYQTTRDAVRMRALSEAGEKLMQQITYLVCPNCKNLDPTGHTFKKCGRCKKVYYCGQSCQKRHWKVHKKTCRKWSSGK